MTRTRKFPLLVFLLLPIILIGSIVGYHYVTTQMEYDALYHQVKAICLQDAALQTFIAHYPSADLCYQCISESENGLYWYATWDSNHSITVHIITIEKNTMEIVESHTAH